VTLAMQANCEILSIRRKYNTADVLSKQ